MRPVRARSREETRRDDLRRRMVPLLERLAPLEGYNLSALPDVRFLRSNRPLKSVPVLYDPGIVIVAQGRKRGYFGDQVYLYDEQHYLAVSVPVPFTMRRMRPRRSRCWRSTCTWTSRWRLS